MEDVAKAIGVSRATISKLISGTYPSDVKDKTRTKIASGLGVEEDTLFPPVDAGKGQKAS